MESYLAERHVFWKEIRNGGYIVRTVSIYLGLACILGVIITKVPLVLFFVYVKVLCVCMPRVGKRCVSWNGVLYILQYLNYNKKLIYD